jgi:hypothetical protein
MVTPSLRVACSEFAEEGITARTRVFFIRGMHREFGDALTIKMPN